MQDYKGNYATKNAQDVAKQGRARFGFLHAMDKGFLNCKAEMISQETNYVESY